MRKLTILSSLLAVALLSVSCVNKDYDLSKLNTEMTLFEEEGIEIPLPETEATEMDIFSVNNIVDELLSQEVEGNISEIDFSEIDAKEIENGLKIVGEYFFDLSAFPESFRAPGTELIFEDDSYFSIDLDNTTGEVMELYCEIYDGVKDTLIGKVEDLRLDCGEGQNLQITFPDIDIARLPEAAVIKNIEIKAVPTKGGLSGVLKFLEADLNINPIVKKGSKLEYDYEFTDFFKETGIDISVLSNYMDAKSFILNAVLISDLPVSLTGNTSGDITASINIESPTPKEGSEVSLSVNCPGGLATIKTFALHIYCTSKADIDLSKLDTYNVSIIPESIKLDTGITIGK